MIKLAWVLTVLCSVLSAFVLIVGLDSAESAPQEAAVAAVACALVIIPYCFARAISELKGKGK